MNYLLIANNEEKIKKLLYDVADFLWDSGNEVCISSNCTECDFT